MLIVQAVWLLEHSWANHE